jgi:hypothetical protein
MRKVKADEILALGAYEQIRDRFRNRIIAHKRERRVLLGPEMSLLFEDHDTVLSQVQEMLRAERISDPKAVQFEIDTYNELVPRDGCLLATLMIEEPDRDIREQKRRTYVGLENAIALDLGAVAIPGKFAPEGLQGDHIAVVQYLTFEMGPEASALLLDHGKPATIVCTHPKYPYRATLDDALRRSIANDLDPANAEKKA